jgi:membrane protease YdiL (CAAX protease family)
VTDSQQERPLATDFFTSVPLFEALQAAAAVVGVTYLSTLLAHAVAGGDPAAPLLRGPASWQSVAYGALIWIPPLVWLWWAFPRTVRLTWHDLGFRRFTRREVAIVVIGTAANLIVVASLSALQHRILHVDAGGSGWVSIVVRSSTLGLRLALVIATGVLLTPLIEEIATRGLLFGAVLGRFGFWPAAVVSSLVFAAYHRDAATFLPFAASGLVLATVFQRTRSLAISYAVHGAYNAVGLGWILFARMGHH